MTATRLVRVAELQERLGSLDMANPTFSEAAAAEHFCKFVESLNILKNGVPPVHWIYGTRDYRARLHDLGFYGPLPERYQAYIRMYSNSIDRGMLNDANQGELPDSEAHITYMNALQQVSELGFEWRFHRSLYFDENVLRAFEAGFGFFVIHSNAIVLFPRPGIRIREEIRPQSIAINGRVLTTRRVLHNMRGPAVTFPNDESSNQYWIRGVRMPRFAVETPENIARAHIRAARTPALRRALIDQYGLLRYSIERGYKQVDRNDKFGAILYVKGGNRSRYGDTTTRECIVELINSTPEPDGTHRHFARRVPGNMQSAHQAVAWTFGFTNPSDYKPAVQT